MTNYIVIIDPLVGKLIDVLDMSDVTEDLENSDPKYNGYVSNNLGYCMNGIAYYKS